MCYIRVRGMPKSSKKVEKITKKTNLGELVMEYPEAGQVLAEEYGLHCVGCMAASFECLEDGLKVHGYSKKEIAKIVRELNKTVKAE